MIGRLLLAPTLRLAAALAWGGLVSGCWGPSFDDAVDKHRERIEAKVAVWSTIREKVATLPRLEADEVRSLGAPLVLDWSSTRMPRANAALVHAEDLEQPE
jgi:hypothetical protein